MASRYAFHDYKKAGADRQQLERWCKEFGWETVLNRAGTTFRKLPEKDKEELNADRAIELMLEQPSMIKRPVLDTGQRLLVGFKPDEYQATLIRRKVIAWTGKLSPRMKQPPPNSPQNGMSSRLRPICTTRCGDFSSRAHGRHRCGSGRDVAWLAANGFDAIGYEPSHCCARSATTLSGFDVC